MPILSKCVISATTVPIPRELLRQAENHACFSGCYSPGNDLLFCRDSMSRLEPALDIGCADCFSFRLGGFASLFGTSMTRDRLAQEVTAHIRALRGFTLSLGGYHTQGGGFWLSAAYWDNIGLFVLRSGHSSTATPVSVVDLLVKAFTTGVALPPHPNMRDPAQYATQKVFLTGGSLPPPTSLQALLGSQNVSPVPRSGFAEVTLAEYLPVARSQQVVTSARTATPVPAVPASPSTRAAAPKVRRSSKLGERCEVCGQIVQERALLSSVYISCGCD